MRAGKFSPQLVATLIAVLTLTTQARAGSGSLSEQGLQTQETGQKKTELKKKERNERFSPDEAAVGDESRTAKPLTDVERQALRREQQSEAEAAVLPYINNFFETVRLGPEDVIAVTVFGQEKYSLSSVTVPPDGRINYPLIGPVSVNGRTTLEVEREITEKLSEYIIEPRVTVQLVQSHSQKFFVVGDVATPGIYEMTRRLTVREALAMAGYITRTGDKQRVHVLRLQPSGQLVPLPVNIKAIEQGRGQDIYLSPGDTVVVPGNKFKRIEQIMSLFSLGAWMRTIAR